MLDKITQLHLISTIVPSFVRIIHGLSCPVILFFAKTLGVCLRTPSMNETADWSRESGSSATEDELPNEDIVVTEARLTLQDEPMTGRIPLNKKLQQIRM